MNWPDELVENERTKYPTIRHHVYERYNLESVAELRVQCLHCRKVSSKLKIKKRKIRPSRRAENNNNIIRSTS